MGFRPPNLDLKNNRTLGRPPLPDGQPPVAPFASPMGVVHDIGGYRAGTPGFVGPQPSNGDLGHMLRGNWASQDPPLNPIAEEAIQQPASK